MLFHSQAFILLFLPVTLFLYYRYANHDALREWVIVIASVIFYGIWDVRFVPLLLLQTTVSWAIAWAYFKYNKKSLIYAGIAINILTLFYFKYMNFFIDNINAVFGHHLNTFDLILPIGISFFTFEIISYLIDCGRGKLVLHPFRSYCLYVFFFPHLIAGPIVRHDELIPQLRASPLHTAYREHLAKGATLFVIGLALKVLVADKLAVIADPVFQPNASVHFQSAWTGVIAFSLQLFFDFSAYSDMALGLALMFGIVLPVNFNRPYHAATIREFWRRWHMTLSRWLRDYVYIPLGGSKEGLPVFIFATLVTFILCGFWHGAAWTFVLWGLAHGVAIICCVVWQTLNIRLPVVVGWLLTILFVVFGWALFRSTSLEDCLTLMQAMLDVRSLASGRFEMPPKIILLAVLIAAIPYTPLEIVTAKMRPHRLLAYGIGILAVVVLLEVGKGQPTNFVYFQF